MGKQVDKRLEELGGRRLLPLGLGDDSGCIELDWEAWQAKLLSVLENDAAPRPQHLTTETCVVSITWTRPHCATPGGLLE